MCVTTVIQTCTILLRLFIRHRYTRKYQRTSDIRNGSHGLAEKDSTCNNGGDRIEVQIVRRGHGTDFSNDQCPQDKAEERGNKPEEEPFIAPLAELVQRISVLSGIACPDLDQTEGALATAVQAGGFDDEQ